MALLYLYLYNYGTLENCEFTFSPQYSFHYDRYSRILAGAKIENLNVYHDYNENIENLTAIVGENGSGKSTLLRFIYDELQHYRGMYPNTFKYIFILLMPDENKENTNFISPKLKVISNMDIEFSKETQLAFDWLNTTCQLSREFDKICVIYYTEAFSPSEYEELIWKQQNWMNNLSVAGRLKRISPNSESLTDLDLIRKYYQEETYRQVDALQQDEIPFDIREVRIKPVFPQSIGYLTDRIDPNVHDPLLTSLKDMSTKFYKDIISYRNDKCESYLRYLWKPIIFSLLQYILLGFHVTRIPKNKIQDAISVLEKWKKIFGKMKESDCLYAFLRCMFKFINVVFKYETIWVDNSGIVPSYKQCIKFLLDKSLVRYHPTLQKFMYNIEENKNRKKFLKFFDAYTICTQRNSMGFLIFEWGLSTGEMAWFNFYAQLLALKRSKSQFGARFTCSHVLLLFDEAGLYWHPRWQQQGVKRILDLMKQIYSEQKIQVIMATHSPLFLSDVPRENVIFLEKNNDDRIKDDGKRKQTFAANIYTLYQDSFFLDGNVWIQGEFSKMYIDKIEKEINMIENEFDDIKNQNKDNSIVAFSSRIEIIQKKINMIGEELIRLTLQQKVVSIQKKMMKMCECEILKKKILNELNQLSADEREQIFLILKQEFR